MNKKVKNSNNKKKKPDKYKIILIVIVIISMINIFIVQSKEIVLINDPDRIFRSDCRGLSYYDDENGKRAKEECLKSIEQDRKQVMVAKKYLENYKVIHIIMACTLLIATITTLIQAKSNKSSNIVLAILIILINLATIVIDFSKY